MDTIFVLRMHRDNPLCWAWMPLVLERVGRFCQRFETETQPYEANDLIRTWFAMGDPRLGLWIGVKNDVQLIGHLLAMPEPAAAEHWKYVLIRQAEVDRGVNIGKWSKLVLDEVKAWTLSMGLSRVMMVTHRVPKVMERRFGFKLYKTIMSCDIEVPKAEKDNLWAGTTQLELSL